MTHTTRRRFVRAIGATTVAGTAASATAKPVLASPRTQGSGTGSITGLEATVIRERGGNRFEERVLTGIATGTLEGTFEQHVSGMVHKSGRVVFDGTMIFDGQVGDCGEGTLDLGISGRGHILTPGFPITEASVRVINQPTNTIAVTGTGTVFQEGPALTYEIQYVCR